TSIDGEVNNVIERVAVAEAEQESLETEILISEDEGIAEALVQAENDAKSASGKNTQAKISEFTEEVSAAESAAKEEISFETKKPVERAPKAALDSNKTAPAVEDNSSQTLL